MPRTRVSCSAMRPRNSAWTRSTPPSARPCASVPRRRQRPTNGATASGSGAPRLTALVTTPPSSAALTCFGGVGAGAVLRLGGRGAEVRRHDHVVAAEERVLGRGLLGEDVERGAGDLARLERGAERLEVDQLAAGAVDDAHAVLHAGERRGVDPVDRLGRLRQVDRDEVGALVELVGRLDALDAEVAEALGGDELVEADDLHVERLGAARDQLADPAEADHAERLAVELVAAVARARPLAADERAMRLRHVAGQRQRQRQRVLGGGDRVRLRRVDDEDAALGRRDEVDVVDAGAGAADDLQVGGLADQVRGDLGRRADDQRVELADPVLERRLVPVESELDVEVLAQKLDAGSAIFSLTRTFTPERLAAHSPRVPVLDHPVDAGGERLDVGGLDRREHPDPQLVAPELAVRLGVDDAVGAKRRGDRGGVDRSSKSIVPTTSERLRSARRRTARRTPTPRPTRRGGRRTRRSARRTSRGRRGRASTRAGRRAGTALRPPACCRSGPCASCRARSRATGTRAASGRRRRRAPRSARSRPG